MKGSAMTIDIIRKATEADLPTIFVVDLTA